MITLIIVLECLIFALLLHRVIFRRTFIASFVECAIRLLPLKYRTLEWLYSDKITDLRVNYKFPVGKLSVPYVRQDVDNMPVYVLGKKRKRAILYLHGGAYVSQPLGFHIKFLNKLAKKVDATIVVPIYPLAPESNFATAHQLITKLYVDMCSEYDSIIVMGDSAGGGMAAALAVEWEQMELQKPHKLVLLSPWVDIQMHNPLIAKLDKCDPMLSALILKEFGKLWAADAGVTDPRVSPIFGHKFPTCAVHIFVGTREILMPDIMQYYGLCKAANPNTHIVVKYGMNHVYPIYPIPEAWQAFGQIKSIVEG